MVRNTLLTLVIYLFISCMSLRKADNRPTANRKGDHAAPAKTDTTRKNKIQPYSEVIGAQAVSDKGLFSVHKVNDRYFFEIPDTLLGREILIVNRIGRAASGMRSRDGMLGYAGDQISQRMVQFSKGANNRIYIRELSFNERSADTTENGLFWSVNRSNLHPYIASFDIKAVSVDSSGVVIDITDFINGENNVLFFNTYHKGQLNLGALQMDKSYVEQVQSFPLNIEIKTLKTYQSANAMQLLTYEINNSIVLLPKEPMRKRYEDPRVGYFGVPYLNYDANPQGVERSAIINRWRLEPKDEDLEKYKRGELVVPEKPIVFYIDPATPKKWVPYFIQGVNDWQKAFEKAGFKNAIYALEAPANDLEWSLEDARHNAIMYKASEVTNASGPHIHDPRTGEIIETHINWYHNVMELLRDWYMVQAGAIDARARQLIFPDSLMGRLIRYVIAHEVGHTLGLAHNMAASSTIPVENLRNKKWLQKNSHTPSIMDYARFNYVAQPEDSISVENIIPGIGVYDEWAIEWGYRIIPAFRSPEEERVYMTKWITRRIAENPMLWYGFAFWPDPRVQTEDLGDDAMKAGKYGIQNLKRIIPHVTDWTKEPGRGYNAARLFYELIINQYKRYLAHAASHIGAFITTDKTVEEAGPVYEFCALEKQRSAVQFLQEELFSTPSWMIDTTYFSLFGEGSVFEVRKMQEKMLRNIMSGSKLAMLSWFQAVFPEKAYTPALYLDDLKSGIWSELKTKNIRIDMCRRNVQKLYVKQLAYLLTRPKGEGLANAEYQFVMSTDLSAILVLHAKQLLAEISNAIPNSRDAMTRLHLEGSRKLLKSIIDGDTDKDDTSSKDTLFNDITDLMLYPGNNNPDQRTLLNKDRLDCWHSVIEP